MFRIKTEKCPNRNVQMLISFFGLMLFVGLTPIAWRLSDSCSQVHRRLPLGLLYNTAPKLFSLSLFLLPLCVMVGYSSYAKALALNLNLLRDNSPDPQDFRELTQLLLRAEADEAERHKRELGLK